MHLKSIIGQDLWISFDSIWRAQSDKPACIEIDNFPFYHVFEPLSSIEHLKSITGEDLWISFDSIWRAESDKPTFIEIDNFHFFHVFAD